MIINDLFNNKKFVAEGLNEFAPDNGGGESGRWYTDGELADIIGDDWFEDFDVSNDGFNIDAYGEKAKKNLVGYANAWFDDKGYNVNVIGVEHNDVDHDLQWYIVGSFQNSGFAKKGMAEASLGDYRKKATVNKAMAQANKFFDRDDAAKVAAADQTIAKRERGLARADARVRPYTPPAQDAEKMQRDLTAKYPNIDELVAAAEQRRDPNYDYAEGNAYYDGREAEQNYQKLKQIQRVIQGLNESLNRSHLP